MIERRLLKDRDYENDPLVNVGKESLDILIAFRCPLTLGCVNIYTCLRPCKKIGSRERLQKYVAYSVLMQGTKSLHN